MVYLYAALGAVMMTGIMAVLEMGLSLTGQSLLLKPEDPYYQGRMVNSVGRRDQQMLNLLHSQADLEVVGRRLQGIDLCDQLLCRASLVGAAGCAGANEIAEDAGERLSSLSDLTRSGVIQPGGNWSNTCALQSGSHRLLIQPDPASVDTAIPYRLFSCVLSGASICDFEPTG